MFFGLSCGLFQTWFTSQFTQCTLIMWGAWVQFWLPKSSCSLAPSLQCTRGALDCVHSTTQQLLALVCLKLLAIIVKYLQLASDLRCLSLATNLNPKSISQSVCLFILSASGYVFYFHQEHSQEVTLPLNFVSYLLQNGQHSLTYFVECKESWYP